jgi:hypothetical protein
MRKHREQIIRRKYGSLWKLLVEYHYVIKLFWLYVLNTEECPEGCANVQRNTHILSICLFQKLNELPQQY